MAPDIEWDKDNQPDEPDLQLQADHDGAGHEPNIGPGFDYTVRGECNKPCEHPVVRRCVKRRWTPA
jgi:hypothetical protein